MDIDWNEIGRALGAFIPAVIFLVFNIFFRKQQEQKKRLTVVRGLLSEIDYNQKTIEALSMQWQTNSFKTATWTRNKDKMDYIDSGLHYTLATAYEIAEEFNREIDMAKKHQSASYMSSIRVDRLRKPLAQSKQGLEEWLQLNKDTEKIFKRNRNSTS